MKIIFKKAELKSFVIILFMILSMLIFLSLSITTSGDYVVNGIHYTNSRNLSIMLNIPSTTVMPPYFPIDSLNITKVNGKNTNSSDVRLVETSTGNLVCFDILSNTSDSIEIVTLVNFSSSTENKTFVLYWGNSSVGTYDNSCPNNMVFTSSENVSQMTIPERYIGFQIMGISLNRINYTNTSKFALIHTGIQTVTDESDAPWSCPGWNGERYPPCDGNNTLKFDGNVVKIVNASYGSYTANYKFYAFNNFSRVSFGGFDTETNDSLVDDRDNASNAANGEAYVRNSDGTFASSVSTEPYVTDAYGMNVGVPDVLSIGTYVFWNDTQAARYDNGRNNWLYHKGVANEVRMRTGSSSNLANKGKWVISNMTDVYVGIVNVTQENMNLTYALLNATWITTGIEKNSPNLSYNSFQVNDTFIQLNDNVSFKINLISEGGTILVSYKFAHNITGGDFRNVTTNALIGSEATVNRTEIINLTRGKNFCVQYWFDDELGFFNQTNLLCVNVSNSVPSTNYSFNSSTFEPSAKIGIIMNFSDVDNDTWTKNDTEWFKNGSIILSAANSTYLDFHNFTYGDVINFSAKAYDGYNWSNQTLYQPNISITIRDTTSPIFVGNTSNQTSVTINIPFELVVNITDSGSNLTSVVAEVESPSGVKANSSLDNASLNAATENVKFNRSYTPAVVGTWYVKFYVEDFAVNKNLTLDRYYSFIVNAAGGETPSGGGGGGGCGVGLVEVNGTCVPVANLTRAPRCGDGFCDAFAGESWLGCPSDCPFKYNSSASWLCSDPDVPCLFSTWIVFVLIGGVVVLSFKQQIATFFRKVKYKIRWKGGD